MSINDYYRDNGIANNQVNQCAPTIQSIQEGSIIFSFLIGKLIDYSVEAIIKNIIKHIGVIKEKKAQGKYKKHIFKFENVEKIEVRVENNQNTVIININD